MTYPHGATTLVIRQVFRGNVDMRVLILTIEFPPFLVGGLGRHTADLSRALSDDGHIVDVVTAARTDSGVNEARSASLTVYRGVCSPAPDSWQQWLLCANIAMIRALYEIPEHRWDVVHMHERSSVYAAQVATRICNAPAVFTAHSLAYSTKFDTELEKAAVEMSSCVIGVSAWMTQELLSRYELPCLHTIPNGVFPKDFERVVRPPQIPGSSLVFVGRLVKNKGIHKLLEAIVGIDVIVPDWTLKIVGSGPEREALESQATQLGIVDRVEFLGHLEKDRVIDVLGQSDLAVFPSIIEPFGIVVLEAMAAGVPVVISSASGIGTIFDDKVHGWKCNVENPDQLRATIITALTSPRRVEMAEKARLLVSRRYDWRQVCQSVEALYRQIIGLEI